MYQRIHADSKANCALRELCAAAEGESMSTVALAVMLTGTGWGVGSISRWSHLHLAIELAGVAFHSVSRKLYSVLTV
jgi:hypothetical protein